MIYKDAAISANVGTSTGAFRTTNINFSTQDIGTAKLSFHLFKNGVPLPLSAVTGKLVMLMADGSKFIKNITIVDKQNGKAEYVLTSDEIKHYGKVQASLNLYYNNNQSLGIIKFIFEINKDLIDSDIAPSAEYYIDDFEDLKQSVETIVADLQEKFKDLDNVETKTGAQEKANAVQSNLDTHTSDKANPHGVTKSQVGLGNVDNVQQASKENFDLHVSDAVKHISTAERSKWNGAQIHKITQDDGRVIYKSATESTDYNDLTDTGMYLIYNKGLNGPGLPYAFLLVMSSKNTLVQIAYDGFKGEQVLFRLRKNDSITWTAWVALESTVGAQKKVDAHANRKDNPHAVTKAQVGLDKVDNVQQAPLTEFNAHNYNSIRHISQIERDKWNGAQLTKLTGDDGKRTFIDDGTDILTLTTGFYQGAGTSMVNSPIPGDGSWFNYDVIEGSSGRKSIQAWKSYDNIMWHATVHTNGVFKGWKKLITDADYEGISWQNVTLKNGAANGDRPFQYAKWGSWLLFRGQITAPREVVIGSIPSSMVPSNGTVVLASTTGITGICKLIVFGTGDLKLTGLMSNDNNAVTGYYMDVNPIPLD
ncbi:BppU family phage baseplate upper protein [Bacillus inaquosorum]|uniref:BppU family phage baseplate upper protein n=1 Tax=Bacillus inaquosorum TaxID=483913 RepID=UPI00227F9E7D|nr:BppU family phage baseplate upper protein [Bacillus inaquosorum]MCY7748639.1 BppU family phage baseplate upper protein [Bacillus inaquosorum]